MTAEEKIEQEVNLFIEHAQGIAKVHGREWQDMLSEAIIAGPLAFSLPLVSSLLTRGHIAPELAKRRLVAELALLEQEKAQFHTHAAAISTFSDLVFSYTVKPLSETTQ